MAFDVNKIIQVVMEGSRTRDEKGIIPIFGVYLSLFFVDYYNRLSFSYLEKMGKRRQVEAATLLIKAAQECAYATFNGIRDSWEWQEVVQPMITRMEDQILGFAAVSTAAGWGDMEIKEIIPKKRLIIKVTGSYEANGYIKKYGLSDEGKCYMLRGVTSAFMDLLYGEDYPDGCFTFLAEEPLCQAKGDKYCEFVV
ncbi:MAG: hypothetical protein ACW963_08450 [Candidatus Sifarchaeia archaeon]